MLTKRILHKKQGGTAWAVSDYENPYIIPPSLAREFVKDQQDPLRHEARHIPHIPLCKSSYLYS